MIQPTQTTDYLKVIKMYEAKIVLGSVVKSVSKKNDLDAEKEFLSRVVSLITQQAPEVSYLDISFKDMKRPFSVSIVTVPHTNEEVELFLFLKDEIEECIRSVSTDLIQEQG